MKLKKFHLPVYAFVIYVKIKGAWLRLGPILMFATEVHLGPLKKYFLI